jgi:NNP family nitrate/nitrite transporter-like MFS transporter
MGMRGRLIWQFICFAMEGFMIMVFSKARSLSGSIAALMTFSIFVQGAEGSTFGIVPYLNPELTGTVAGIIGAGGNTGAVIFSIVFQQLSYRDAFFWMGTSTACISILSSLVWIKGYQGLFFRQRVLHSPQKRSQSTTLSHQATDAPVSMNIDSEKNQSH